MKHLMIQHCPNTDAKPKMHQGATPTVYNVFLNTKTATQHSSIWHRRSIQIATIATFTANTQPPLYNNIRRKPRIDKSYDSTRSHTLSRKLSFLFYETVQHSHNAKPRHGKPNARRGNRASSQRYILTSSHHMPAKSPGPLQPRYILDSCVKASHLLHQTPQSLQLLRLHLEALIPRLLRQAKQPRHSTLLIHHPLRPSNILPCRQPV